MGNKPEFEKEQTPEEVLRDSYVKLMRAARSIRSYLSTATKSYAMLNDDEGNQEFLTYIGIMVVNFLYYREKDEGKPLPTQQEISEHLIMSKSEVQHVIQTLLRYQMVEQEKEGRRWRIKLTQTGRDFFDKIYPEHTKRIKRFMTAATSTRQNFDESYIRKIKKFGELCSDIGKTALDLKKDEAVSRALDMEERPE